jgi:hypothetical protein
MATASEDIRSGHGYADGDDGRARREPDVRRKPETKTFIGTSEFWVMVGAVVVVLLAGYAFKDIAKATSWRLMTWIAIAYIASRGLAKAGSQRDYDRIDR